jgi:glutamate synthase (NADPH/NADH) large chain
VITPLQDDDLVRHPNATLLKQLKQSCRRLIIDGPNCVIGCLPDHSVFMVQDRKKLRPGVVGGRNQGSMRFLRNMRPGRRHSRRDKSKDFQPMHLDTAIVGPDRQEDQHMLPDRPIAPSTLSIKDLPWQIEWRKDKCTLCGRCTAVCPVNAIELGVFRKRVVATSLDSDKPPSNVYTVFHGIRQKTDPAYACVGCAMCSLVCPNDAIFPLHSDEADKLRFHINRGGQPRRRGGRRNASGGILDQIKFIRISMLTDPALDAGRHEFELRTLLGRILPPEQNLKFFRENGWMPPVREIYPLIIGSMSFGALSPNMWEGLQMGVAYLNEELGMPVRMCTGEGGCPPRLLRSRFLKYTILQIASGYFGWDEIIHAMPEMKEDPCAIEIKYGQGAKPGDGGLLMWHKVNQLIAAIRGVPRESACPARPLTRPSIPSKSRWPK